MLTNNRYKLSKSQRTNSKMSVRKSQNRFSAATAPYQQRVHMYTLLSCLCALSTLVPPTNALANCPSSCQCDDDTLVVKCGEGALDVLPITLNPFIQRLVIQSNKIKTIDSSLQFYAELLFLDLSYNDLVTLPMRTFQFQRKLQELHLNHNKIGQISNMTFVGLAALTVLNLRGNLLAELEQGTFAKMSKLAELNLGQNRINRIDPHAFDGLVNLRTLYLDDNTLTTVPAPSIFQAMPNLAELYLGTNSFTSIQAKAFIDLKGLTRLDLRGAGLHNISAEALKGLEGLRYLDLADNRLHVVPTNALSHLERLEELLLGQNDFEVIGSGAFGGLTQLRKLEITGAQRLRSVQNGAFSANTNLEHLNLSSNKMLQEVQENALGGLPHLRHVILKENDLHTIAEGLVPWTDLQTLDLSDNPIVCDCQVLWLRNLLVSKNSTTDRLIDVMCVYPEPMRKEPLAQLSPAMLGCSHSDTKQQAMIIVVVVVTTAIITGLSLLIYGCRRRIRETLKGGWGNSALGRKEREYQKTCSDEEYMTRQQHPCSLSIQPTMQFTNSVGYNMQQTQPYMGSRPIPVTEL
ncbi:insulin-like growth factor-binding protein complex acid labile subunit [Bactrocera neohumeralis]|uniref:insulin-like growth factor-binding protein complex acid labile subunit n=1 Tax=Bactrocera neohumeralis TaxID=98809 RepID=UPI002165D71F|nr:insulin-like growth factor-binding protein complex acid labile subunit [Bactrocera neohumeralis]XP_050336390.1 insulin-like growth factor-binding protein complex acid labile subunit [Bactrocera neohumeralis]XP_050336391.1 insulin-like growth factor-binding protein complex acid labile subunit [Bactrocera neohumeralis]XP_050336392.1 insulin-like growth factor-binding protein complex acid labile subunit [Bactrocera neohumeralis]XP_050336393.1 insulin-like growth factor-binding protein complex a